MLHNKVLRNKIQRIYRFSGLKVIVHNCLSTVAIQCAPLLFQSMQDVHCFNDVPLSILGVGSSTKDSLSRNIERPRNAFDATPPGQTPDGDFRNGFYFI